MRALLAVTLVLATIGVSAQSSPQFEVASVKRSTSSAPGFTMAPSTGRFTATNVPLRFLIGSALRVPNYRLDGGPAWINSERYDIQATAAAAASPRWREMLRSLLIDRFKLATHTERRSMQGFALMLARTDGRLGERLRRTDACEPTPAFPPCAQARESDHSYQMNRLPLSGLMAMLTQRVGGPIEDRTGLTGTYVLELDWALERRPGSPDAVADDGVVLFTALQEQLGLRLQREQLDVDVIVIDRVERPAPD